MCDGLRILVVVVVTVTSFVLVYVTVVYAVFAAPTPLALDFLRSLGASTGWASTSGPSEPPFSRSSAGLFLLVVAVAAGDVSAGLLLFVVAAPSARFRSSSLSSWCEWRDRKSVV